MQLRLPITFVIINNGRYEALMQFGRHFGLTKLQGIHLPDIDFRGIAQAQGCRAETIRSADQLDAALTAAFTADEPTLVNVHVQ